MQPSASVQVKWRHLTGAARTTLREWSNSHTQPHGLSIQGWPQDLPSLPSWSANYQQPRGEGKFPKGLALAVM